MNDIESEILEWAKDYAQKNGLLLNPDYDLVVGAIKGLAQNKREYGIQYCGCRQVTGDAKKDADLICPCIHRTLDIQKRGSCKCGLFVK
ncbi:MAG: FtrB (plasmid) [Candidatus Methanoperedens sp.]|nr:MAG: FtrB [Candidatus Methanoperedens sp.]